MPIVLDAEGDQAVHVGAPPALMDLEGERIGPDESVRPGVERSGVERLDLLVELDRIRDTWLLDSEAMRDFWTSLSIRRVEMPSR